MEGPLHALHAGRGEEARGLADVVDYVFVFGFLCFFSYCRGGGVTGRMRITTFFSEL